MTPQGFQDIPRTSRLGGAVEQGGDFAGGGHGAVADAGQGIRFIGRVERAGYTLVPLDLHYKRGMIKLEVGLAKGKKQHDKRATIREREWGREQQRLLRQRPGSSRAG